MKTRTATSTTALLRERKENTLYEEAATRGPLDALLVTRITLST